MRGPGTLEHGLLVDIHVEAGYDTFMNTQAVDIRHLEVTLPGGVRAIRRASVQLPAGKIVGIIGPSGAGKTTLIRSIVGRQRSSKGTISVLGKPAGSPDLRRRVRYMTQGLSVYPDLNVWQNLAYFAVMAGEPKRQTHDMIRAILATVDMTRYASVLVQNLSGGQKQRVSLAIALIGSPELLALDEPTVGLDPVLREQLWQLFRELAEQGKTLLVSSHSMDEARRCDDLVLIRDGTILAHNSPEELCKQTKTTSVEQAFLRLVEDQA